MRDLFGGREARAPLAERLRPRALDEVVGQDHLTGGHGILRRAVESGEIPSMIL
ncbi:MAG: replication-associated recombination protein A, partial [Candidatus Eisenbacteria bacterium]